MYTVFNEKKFHVGLKNHDPSLIPLIPGNKVL